MESYVRLNLSLPALAILLASILLCSCNEPEALRIGFLGELTGRAVGLGTSGRDGFLLAIEEVNIRGGIKGRKVEAVVHDTRTDQQSTVQAIHHMSDQKVAAIIGPMTSQTAVAAVPEFNRAQIPAISPTVSSNQLAGRDDYFFRVYYTNAQAEQLLADKLVTQSGIRKITVLHDQSNRAYTEDWIQHFQDALIVGGGNRLAKTSFDSRSNPVFTELVKKALAGKPEAILILANAVDTAMICQQISKQKVNLPRYATGWSYSDDLIQFGGKSVEGLTVIRSADMNASSPSTRKFVEAFRERFREDPKFPTLHAYDATRMLLTALEKCAEPRKLRQALLTLDPFEGLQSDLAFDQYGDLRQPTLHLARIEGSLFVRAD